MIGQAELAKYFELKEQVKRLKEKLGPCRKRLMSLLEDGAPIEPGSLHAEVRCFEQRRLLEPDLVRLLGRAEVAELKRLVEPKPTKQLWVY
jgi:hypothetical protein